MTVSRVLLLACVLTGCGEPSRSTFDAGRSSDVGEVIDGSNEGSDAASDGSSGADATGASTDATGANDAGAAAGTRTAKVFPDASRHNVNLIIENVAPIECGDTALVSNSDYLHVVLWPGTEDFDANDLVGSYEECRDEVGRRCAWGISVVGYMVDVMYTSVTPSFVVESQTETTLTGTFTVDGTTTRFEAEYCGT